MKHPLLGRSVLFPVLIREREWPKENVQLETVSVKIFTEKRKNVLKLAPMLCLLRIDYILSLAENVAGFTVTPAGTFLQLDVTLNE